jgi:Mn-dependent DtxR family transcriptional regulator
MQKRNRLRNRRTKIGVAGSHYVQKNRGMKSKAFKCVLNCSELFENLKRDEEDVLKYIYEKDDEGANINAIKQVFREFSGEIDMVIEELTNKNYIIERGDQLILTPKGKEIAELIFRIHNEIEEYIKGKNLSCNAHQMAHILEHELTEDQVEKMIKIAEFKDKGISLPNFKLPVGTIVEVTLSNCKVWTKIVSVGIFPGQRIHILSRSNSNFLIEIKNSKFAIDQSLAKGIYLIP